MLFRLVLLSVLVGVILKVLGLDPFNIIRSIERAVRAIWDMGFDAVVLAVALFPARRRRGRADLADRAAACAAPRGRVTSALRRFEVTHARVFAIAGPAMLANLTTPLLGLVAPRRSGGSARRICSAASRSRRWCSTASSGCSAFCAWARSRSPRRRSAPAMRPSSAPCCRARCCWPPSSASRWSRCSRRSPRSRRTSRRQRGGAAGGADLFLRAHLVGAVHARQLALLGWLVGHRARRHRAGAADRHQRRSTSRSPSLLVLGLDFGIAGAALAAVLAEAAGFGAGLVVAWRLLGRGSRPAPRSCSSATSSLRMLVGQSRHHDPHRLRDRRRSPSSPRRARAPATPRSPPMRCCTTSCMIGSFFLDGMATAAEQLCGRAVGARDRSRFVRATRLALGWGLGFGVACDGGLSASAAPALIDLMTTSPEVRAARARVHAVRRARAGAGRARLYLSTASISARPGRATCAT